MSAPGVDETVRRFRFQRLLNQDQAGRRVSLLGSIDDRAAILLAERAAFATADDSLTDTLAAINKYETIGSNDIYGWILGWTSGARASGTSTVDLSADLKLTLIHPCTEKHIKKYTVQGIRMVTETPEIYRSHIRPYMQSQRDAGRLNWVFNIIEGRAEQESIIYRQSSKDSDARDEGFLLTPDLNWDGKTVTSLHLLGLVERRDLWSVRDLNKAHVPWLAHMQERMKAATTKLFPQIDEDQLKLYVHYQPTYYHFHIHVVHVMLEAGATQAVGKALALENIVSQLRNMPDASASMQDVTLTYSLGEESDLWKEVFEPLKQSSKLGRTTDEP